MRIAKVVGNVTVSQSHATFKNCRLRLVVPLTLQQLALSQLGDGKSVISTADAIEGNDELLVAWDDCSAGIGTLVALAEGPEAAQPFYPELKPIDAAIVALLDSLHLDSATINTLTKS